MNIAQLLASGPKLRPKDRKALKAFVEAEYLSVLPPGVIRRTEEIATDLNRTIMDVARYLRLMEQRGLVECMGRILVPPPSKSMLTWRRKGNTQ